MSQESEASQGNKLTSAKEGCFFYENIKKADWLKNEQVVTLLKFFFWSTAQDQERVEMIAEL